MAAITVYCSSSEHLDAEFHQVARSVGRELGRRGITLVYGGGGVGLMGVMAEAAQQAGGPIVGIITTFLMDRERGKADCNEMLVVDTMRERKRLLAERGDGFLVLPGGIGTYEEFFEVLVARHLGEHDKPIGIVNSHGYYNPLIAMIEHGIEHRFIRHEHRALFHIDPDPVAVLDWVVDQCASTSSVE